MKLNSVKFQSIVNVLMNAATKSTIRCQHSCAIISGGKIISIAVNVIGFHAELHCKKYYFESKVIKISIQKISVIAIKFGQTIPYACFRAFPSQYHTSSQSCHANHANCLRTDHTICYQELRQMS